MAIASGKLWLNVLSAYDSFQCNQIEIDWRQLVVCPNQPNDLEMVLRQCWLVIAPQ